MSAPETPRLLGVEDIVRINKSLTNVEDAGCGASVMWLSHAHPYTGIYTDVLVLRTPPQATALAYFYIAKAIVESDDAYYISNVVAELCRGAQVLQATGEHYWTHINRAGGFSS